MITFPRSLPSSFARDQEFRLQRLDYGSPEAGGYMGGVQAGFPRWVATWNVGRMTRANSDAFEAWLDSLRGMQRHFYGRDLRRPFPAAYPEGFAGLNRAGGGAFDGSATTWGVATDAAGNCRLTLTGLPIAFPLALLDYVGFKWDAAGAAAGSYGRRALVRVVEATFSSGVGALTATVEPPVPMVVPNTAIAHLDNPCCLMKLQDGTKPGTADRRLVVSGGSVVALQDLLA